MLWYIHFQFKQSFHFPTPIHATHQHATPPPPKPPQITIGFWPESILSLMRLIVAILFAGNMTYTTYSDSDICTLNETHASLAMVHLMGVTF